MVCDPMSMKFRSSVLVRPLVHAFNFSNHWSNLWRYILSIQPFVQHVSREVPYAVHQVFGWQPSSHRAANQARLSQSSLARTGVDSQRKSKFPSSHSPLNFSLDNQSSHAIC